MGGEIGATDGGSWEQDVGESWHVKQWMVEEKHQEWPWGLLGIRVAVFPNNCSASS